MGRLGWLYGQLSQLGSLPDFDVPKNAVRFVSINGHRQRGAARPIRGNFSREPHFLLLGLLYKRDSPPGSHR
jgi:hypothetical protein